jgi:hypothetical protein
MACLNCSECEYASRCHLSDEAKQWIIEAHNELKTIKQLVNDCAGDESDCRIMYEKLYILINGEER